MEQLSHATHRPSRSTSGPSIFCLVYILPLQASFHFLISSPSLQLRKISPPSVSMKLNKETIQSLAMMFILNSDCGLMNAHHLCFMLYYLKIGSGKLRKTLHFHEIGFDESPTFSDVVKLPITQEDKLALFTVLLMHNQNGNKKLTALITEQWSGAFSLYLENPNIKSGECNVCMSENDLAKNNCSCTAQICNLCAVKQFYTCRRAPKCIQCRGPSCTLSRLLDEQEASQVDIYKAKNNFVGSYGEIDYAQNDIVLNLQREILQNILLANEEEKIVIFVTNTYTPSTVKKFIKKNDVFAVFYCNSSYDDFSIDFESSYDNLCYNTIEKFTRLPSIAGITPYFNFSTLTDPHKDLSNFISFCTNTNEKAVNIIVDIDSLSCVDTLAESLHCVKQRHVENVVDVHIFGKHTQQLKKVENAELHYLYNDNVHKLIPVSKLHHFYYSV